MFWVDCQLGLGKFSSTIGLCSTTLQFTEVEKGIENLLNAIMMGICGESTRNKMAELETRKSELQIQIDKEELGKPMVSREIIVFWFH